MTELTFLLDLLLNEKLTRRVREKIAARMKEVETAMTSRGPINVPQMTVPAGQSPSTIAAMQRQAQEIQAPMVSSPVVQNALNERQVLLNQGDKPLPGRSGPRKF